jgi:quinolinate synthase
MRSGEVTMFSKSTQEALKRIDSLGNKDNTVILSRTYQDEDLIDLEDHIWDALSEHPECLADPDTGFMKGSFKVVITYDKEG